MENSDDNCARHWTRVKILGSGAFGVVELWKNDNNGENIAVKRCQLVPQNMSPRQVERWKEEVEFMKIIKHPNIVSTKPLPNEIVDPNSKLPILCMEYCKKGDLRQVLSRPENVCGVEEREALKMMQSIASAVEYLHGLRITHRDLKPENIVLQEGRNGMIYKLMDLGFAKELGNESIAASVVGTLNYLAPELLWKKTYSCSVDYWSLGILFYEILKGTRPFLPNCGINKSWIEHVAKKQYDEISAREIDDKVTFSTTIDDPSNVSQCLRDLLLPWFRLVLQFDPSKRGKIMENNQPTIAVFKMLKGIFDKKIIHLFFVSGYKKEAYGVTSSTTVFEVQKMISEKEEIQIKDQILVTWKGRLLENSEEKIVDSLEDEVLIIFERDKLSIDNMKKMKIPEDVERMHVPVKKCDYFTLKCYYGASVFFMKQELELLNDYIIALSIKIDLCDSNFDALSAKIEKMVQESSALQSELQELSPEDENEPTTSRKLTTSQQLRKKITNFVSSAQGISNELQSLHSVKEKWKVDFSNVSSEKLAEIVEEAEEELKNVILDEQKRSQTPKKMLLIYFKFLNMRAEVLSSEDVSQVAQGFLDVESELVKLEISLKSFETLLPQYQRELLDFKGGNSMEICVPNSETNPGCDDELVKNNIVLGHLISGLLTEMEDIKTKLASLD